MQLPLQTFTALVEQMAASVQGAAISLIDVSVGTVLRALLEASASAGLWLQWLILQVLQMTRASTSVGLDLDSWMADFGLARLPASAAAGTVTFSRYTSGLAASIPVGAQVRTTDGTQSFAVLAAPGTPGWDGGSAYTLAANAASIDLPVQAMVAGPGGNVQALAISVLASAIPGVDTVSNLQAFGGGVASESDPALRQRFTDYINSRSLATASAVGAAVLSIRQGLRYALAENQDANGHALPGSFCLTVDDGSGAPSSALLATVQGSVDLVRPLGSSYIVQPPEIVPAAVGLTIAVESSGNKAAIASTIVQSVGSWIEQLPIGGVLAISRIITLAHEADPAVLSVSAVTINGVATDLVLAANAVALNSGTVVS